MPAGYKARLLAASICLVFLAASRALAQSGAAEPEAEVTALLKEVTALRAAKKEAEAIKIAEKALSIAEQSFPAGSDKLVRPLGVLGWAYYGQNRYADSERLLLRALEIREKSGWQVKPSAAGFCLILGNLYFVQGKLDRTVAIYKRFSDFAEPMIAAKTVRPDDPEVHEVSGLLQEVYVAMSRPADAEQLLKHRISLTEQALGYDHPYVGDLLNTLASLYQSLGRAAEAGPLFERSLAVAEKALANPATDFGPSLTRQAMAGKLNAVAQHYEKTGQPGRAEEVFKLAQRAQAPAPAVEAKPDDDPEALAREARQYEIDKRAADAEAVNRRIVAYWEKALAARPDDKTAATKFKEIARKLAQEFYQSSRYADAGPLFQRVLSLEESEGGKLGVAAALEALADIAGATGRYEDAETQWKKALGIREAEQGVEHQDVSVLRYKLYKFYTDRGRRADAEAVLGSFSAAAERMAKAAPATRDVLADLDNWGSRPDTRTRYNMVEWQLLDTAHTGMEYAGSAHLMVARPLMGAGFSMANEKNWRDAVAVLSRAAGIQIASLRRSGATVLPEAAASPAPQGGDMWVPQTPAEWANATFGRLMKAGYELAGQDTARAPGLRDSLFETAQWGQHSAAAAALTQMAARQNDPKLGALARERQELASEWQDLDKQLTAHLALPPEERRRLAGEEETRRQRQVWIDGRIRGIDQTLAADFPRYAGLVNPEPLTPDGVQALLNDGEALVLFYDVPSLGGDTGATFVWAVTKTAVRWARLDLDGAAIAARVQALRCGLDPSSWLGDGERKCQGLLDTRYSAADMEAGKPLPFDVRKSHELYKALFGPIEADIAGAHLLTVPAGALTALPLQVLVTDDPGAAPVAPDISGQTPWLGVRQPLTVLPSVPSLKALRKLVKEGRASKPFIGFGNPLLTGPAGDDRSAWEVRQCQKAAAVSTASRTVSAPPPAAFKRNVKGDAELLRRQPPLPETAGELCAVAKSLGAADSDVWLGERATAGSVMALSRSGDLAGYRTIHFATHGLVAGDLGTLNEPALLMTPPENPVEGDDGLLKASDVTQLNLDAQWVVMSACNTAAGGKAGAEALSGLARAFFYAGARALLVSHWAVNSTAATELTTGTFSAMASPGEIGRSEALRRTMAALAKSPDAGKRHPSYWAPFVVAGEGAR